MAGALFSGVWGISHAEAATYRVYQYDKSLQVYSSYDAALAYAKLWDHARVVGYEPVRSAWDNYPVVKPGTYQVYQNSTPLGTFDDQDNAAYFARLWDHSKVVNKADGSIVWSNYLPVTTAPQPKYAYVVYQYSNELKQFVSYADALAYAQRWDHASIVAIANNAWVWDNYPQYRVYQYEKLLREFRTYSEALAYAKLWDHSSVRKTADNSWVWDNYQVKKIVIDPGHGGWDPGAIAADGTQEKTVVLAFALKAKAELLKRGYQVAMVRETDKACAPNTTDVAVDLQCRADFAKNNGGHLFVSLHANSFTSSGAYGTESYYNSSATYDGHSNPYPTESRELATILNRRTVQALGTYDRGVDESAFYVLRNNTVPATLVELAFMSNDSDVRKMKDAILQQRFAVEFANGIDEYYDKR